MTGKRLMSVLRRKRETLCLRTSTSHLPFKWKIIERAATCQVHSFMSTHDLYPPAQSPYCKYHSTETTLLEVKNDILLNMNKQHVTLLVLLDLSAAFDTWLIMLSYFSISFEDLVFPVQPSTGSSPILLANRSVSQLMVCWILSLSLTVVFHKVPALNLSCLLYIPVSDLILLSHTFLKFTPTRTAHKYIHHSGLTHLLTRHSHLMLWNPVWGIYEIAC